ncbi:MAG: beta-galactosidase, partial [Prevotellaceae bacterium]|nr:beta-galactosidase [Prevotellaceae bacterium]
QPDKNWGYVQFKTSKEVTDEYIKFIEQLKETVSRGYSAAVYTQTTDVESEVNGLITYDRKVIKVEENRVKQANREVCNSLKQ